MTILKKHAHEAIKGAADRYLSDLRSLTDEQFSQSPGGTARPPADFTYEVMFINERIAKRLRGEDPGPFKFEGWMKAPSDFGTREEVVAKFEKSTNQIIEALETTPVEEMERKITTPGGETSPFDLVTFGALHINYHDAQLNYIQSLNGDTEMHWQD